MEDRKFTPSAWSPPCKVSFLLSFLSFLKILKKTVTLHVENVICKLEIGEQTVR